MAYRRGVRRQARIDIEQGFWLEQEAERLDICQAELIRQAIERLRAGPPAQFRWERYERAPYWRLEDYVAGRIGLYCRRGVLKAATLSQEQAHWIEQESHRVAISQVELIRQAIERLQAGPPAQRPADPRLWLRRMDWLHTTSASTSAVARQNRRYRPRNPDENREN
jgi:hypothetical protein